MRTQRKNQTRKTDYIPVKLPDKQETNEDQAPCR